MIRDGRIAPQPLAVVDMTVIHIPDITALPNRPRPSEICATVEQSFPQHTITSPMRRRKSFQLSFILDVQRHSSFERRPRDRKPAASMRENHIADLTLRADVIALRGVESGEVGQQRAPEDVRVCFDEDVPLLVGIHLKGLADHRQELPFVQPPAWIRRFAAGAVLRVACWAAEIGRI